MNAKHTSVAKAAEPAKEKHSSLAVLTGRAVNNLLRTWQEVKGTARSAIGGSKGFRPGLPDEDVPVLIRQIKACLEPKGGEVTARANTVELGKLYLQLNTQGRIRFFELLGEKYDLDHDALAKKAEALAKAEGDDRRKAERALRDALLSPRVRLFRQFNALPDGFKFLVDMRGAMLSAVKEHPAIVPVEDDLKQVLSGWFDIGLLDMEEISWRSPAELLEKLMHYEAVHPIRSWDDLKNRLDADRRVFGFFHNKMPLEPLIFVQVAFTKGLADSVQELLDETKPLQDVAQADTAIFYSISNAQAGLAGISFGNFLIKRVVGTLTKEAKQIKQFATLSPVPGFCKWLHGELKKAEDAKLFTPVETRDLIALKKGAKTASEALEALLAEEGWHTQAKLEAALKPILTRLVTRYLTQEKRRGKQALDPVAHFHLSNGAQLEQINWLGDTSAKGFKQSAGLMVNYHYILSDIDDNHEDYVTDGRVATSRTVQNILKS